MTFNQFLMLFLNDDSPWGDLAGDCLDDEFAPSSPLELNERVKGTAAEEAAAALTIAWVTYQVSLGKYPGLKTA